MSYATKSDKEKSDYLVKKEVWDEADQQAAMEIFRDISIKERAALLSGTHDFAEITNGEITLKSKEQKTNLSKLILIQKKEVMKN